MTSDLLQTILSDRDEFDQKDGAYVTDADTSVEVIYSTGSAPVQITKVSAIALNGEYVTVDTDASTYCLAYDDIVGLKITRRKEAVPRAGFGR